MSSFLGKLKLATVPFAVAAVMTVGGAPATAGDDDRRKPDSSAPESAAEVEKVDRDEDRVFDDLESRLAEEPAGEDIPVIVTLRKDASRERIDEIEEEVGTLDDVDRFEVIDAFSATVTEEQIATLADSPEVEHVEEDSPVYAFNASAQQSFGVAKARSDAPGLDGDSDGAPTAYSGRDLVAAVIDTGIDKAHPDLDGGKVIGFKDFVNDRSGAYDDQGHGTHVAGTIAGEGTSGTDDGRGVAPGAGLVGVKVLDSNGSGRTSDVVAGIDWVVAHKGDYGIEAINLSLGTSGCSDGTDADSQAVDRAVQAGIVVAVAAGNEGPGRCKIGSPGAAAGALTVGAMADTGAGGFHQAYFSSRGRTLDGRLKPDVSAPGVKIRSAKANSTGYETLNGTSMATPFAAGTALLMLDADSDLAPDEIRRKMRDTAIDWGLGDDNTSEGSSGRDIDYGAGRLDAYAALASAGAILTAPPLAPKHVVREGSLSGSGDQDQYAIPVSDRRFPIAATMIMPGVTEGESRDPDFDIGLFDPSGSEVAASTYLTRQEELSHNPASTGTYTLRVRSNAGAGNYFVDLSGGEAVKDEVSPEVTSISPGRDAAGVKLDEKVAVTFSEPMDRPAAQAAFTLTRERDGAQSAGGFSWTANTMTFTPSAPLAAGERHVAAVSDGARDEAGNRLSDDESWTFTTVASTPVAAFPASVTRLQGALKSGSVTSLRADDNVFYRLYSTTSSTRVTSWLGSFTKVPNTLTDLKITYRGLSGREISQAIDVYRFATATWVSLDVRTISTTEGEVAGLVPPGAATDYVSGATGAGDVRVRVKCRSQVAKFISSGELLRIDYLRP